MIEYASQQERNPFRLEERERERRKVEEDNCYNQKLDLWNTTRLVELNKEDECRRIMERMDSKNKL